MTRPVPLLPSPASLCLEPGLGDDPGLVGLVPRRCPSDGSVAVWHWKGTHKLGRGIISLSKHQQEASCCGDDTFLLPRSQESSFFSDIIICCHGNQTLRKRCSRASWCRWVHLGHCARGYPGGYNTHRSGTGERRALLSFCPAVSEQRGAISPRQAR